MAASTDAQELRAAWRALDGGRGGEGWRTIAVSAHSPCLVLAGRQLPGNEEALLVGFNDIVTATAKQLPRGHGFEVSRLPAGPTEDDRLWLALARRSGGSLELFAMMAEDLLRLLRQTASQSGDILLLLFLSRIRAWQDFMDRHSEGVLAPEAELGLYGELVILGEILAAGMAPQNALDIWQGPLDGLHDFMPGTGGIEVKSTLAAGDFPAVITSLDQLDDNLRQPLFLAAVRLALDAAGTTLPGLADKIREQLAAHAATRDLLDVRLIQAGLLPTVQDRYHRRFRNVSTAILAVQNEFPRLTRANVHPAIRKARYDLHLDLSAVSDVGLPRALQLLEAI